MKFTTVDEYISSFPNEVRAKLEELRAVIKSVAPDAEEKISYQIAAFELGGKNLIHYAGWKKHISIYPIPSGSTAFNKQVSKYVDGKGTLKFPLEQPLPLKLIAKSLNIELPII